MRKIYNFKVVKTSTLRIQQSIIKKKQFQK